MALKKELLANNRGLLRASFLIMLLMLAVYVVQATADTIYLKNGQQLKGTVIRESEDKVVLELEGGTIDFSRIEIEHIEKGELSPLPPSFKELQKEEDKGLITYKGRSYTKKRFEHIKQKLGLVEHNSEWMTSHSKLGLELDDGSIPYSVKKISAYASPAVVSVNVDGARLGSGVLINSNGLFLTNSHVINGAKEIKVKLFNDESEYSARIVTENETYDLALVSMGGTNRPYLKLAEPDEIIVGDPVIAMGNPFGLSTTVTTGIISSVRNFEDFPGAGNLPLEKKLKKVTFIQTDAAINPGNSGGPLLNKKGKIIGINSFAIPKLLAEGLNFALHAKEIQKIYSSYFE